jgi:DNA-binding GntR family transcriptional regulator
MLYERGSPENCEFEEHRDLVKAIAEGRGDDAAGLMEVHLAGIENRLDLTPRKKKIVDLKSVLSAK